jgi:hypothetical protein
VYKGSFCQILIMLLWSTLTAYFLVFLLDSRVLLWVVIVLGQGHFFVSYFYLNKIGRIDHQYFKKFLFLLFFFGFICYAITFEMRYFDWFMFFTSMIFVLHYFYDEAKLSRVKPGRDTVLLFLPVLISFVLVYLVKYFEVTYIDPYFVLGTVSVFALLGLYKVWDDGVHGRQFLFFYCLSVFLPLSFLFMPNINVVQISSFIILFHYVRWYLYYYEKFSTNESKKDLEDYINIVLWVNLLVVLLFTLYSLDPKRGFLILLFNPLAFYGWTCIHIFLSMRKTDFQSLVK